MSLLFAHKPTKSIDLRGFLGEDLPSWRVFLDIGHDNGMFLGEFTQDIPYHRGRSIRFDGLRATMRSRYLEACIQDSGTTSKRVSRGIGVVLIDLLKVQHGDTCTM
jgi:hypothetical protein